MYVVVYTASSDAGGESRGLLLKIESREFTSGTAETLEASLTDYESEQLMESWIGL